MSNRLALVSVYNKDGLAEFVRKLNGLGIDVLSTGGTLKYLEENGVKVKSVSDYTGSPEILDGRVKTLHPKIHGGILARRDREDDMRSLTEQGIDPIEFVIVNLYPFTQKVRDIESSRNVSHGSQIELIDIGGPTMIRAAAKNCKFVVPICDPTDYDFLISELQTNGDISYATRQRLAAKVFSTMAAYDAEVARYFSLEEQLLEKDGARKTLAPVEARVFKQTLKLRYGENPHQKAAFYQEMDITGGKASLLWEQLQGKEISYNNLVDMTGALDLFIEFYKDLRDKHVAVIIKHTNPCGVAVRKTALDAFTSAKACDPISAFGGIVAVSGTVDKSLAEKILADFVEIVCVGDVTPEALETFKQKKNVRLIKCDYQQMAKEYDNGEVTIRNTAGGYLLQTSDNKLASLNVENIVSGDPNDEILDQLRFAWKVCKHVKSNTIVVAKDFQAIGVGAGQMSRVDSAKISIQRAMQHGFDVKGAVAASDAFLPFSDTLEILNDAGVVGLVQPGGSIKDSEVIECAKKRGVFMVMTGERHFKH